MSALSHSRSRLHSSRCPSRSPLSLHRQPWSGSDPVPHPPPSPSSQAALNAGEPHKVARRCVPRWHGDAYQGGVAGGCVPGGGGAGLRLRATAAPSERDPQSTGAQNGVCHPRLGVFLTPFPPHRHLCPQGGRHIDHRRGAVDARCLLAPGRLGDALKTKIRISFQPGVNFTSLLDFTCLTEAIN
jgi:hypothetical protein